MLVTAWNDNIAAAARVLNPASRRFVVGRATGQSAKAGLITFHLRPDAKGRRLLSHPAYRVTLRLWVSYIPLYAFQKDTGYYQLHPGTKCSMCHGDTRPRASTPQ